MEKITKNNESISKTLRGFNISLSGFDKASERTKIVNNIKLLGGVFYEHLDERTCSCLLVKRVGRKEFHQAVRLNIPTITIQWLLDCLERQSALEYRPYLVPPFLGLVISCTQILPEERTKVQKLVETNGGIYSSNLVKDETTHLVAKEAEGDKFKYAKSWKISIVSLLWIEECVRQKRWLSELDFTLSSLQDNRTKKQSKKVPITSTRTESKTKPTVVDTSLSLFLSEEELLSSVENVLTKIPVSLLSSLSSSSSSSSLEEKRKEEEPFKGEVFFIDGFRADMADFVTSLVLKGGGVRSFVLTDNVTKALLGDSSSSVVWSSLRTHPLGCPCLSLAWLLCSLLPFSQVRDLLRDKTPFAEIVSFDWERVKSMEDLCNCKQLVSCVNNASSGPLAPPVSVQVEVPVEVEVPGISTSTGTSIPIGNNYIALMPPPAPVRRGGGGQDIVASLNHKRAVIEKYGIRRNISTVNSNDNKEVSSKRSKTTAVDLDDESQVVVYRNSSFFDL